MHPLQNGSQTTEKPPANNPIGDAGYFTESGTVGRPSVPGADYFNAQIAEFKTILSVGGIEFNPGKFDHIVKVIQKLIAQATPDVEVLLLKQLVGISLSFLDEGARDGWVDLKGGELSRTVDKLLWDYAVAANMVVSQADKDTSPRDNAMKFGDGDGSTTFTVPNYHLGHFVRGAPAGVLHGQTQGDAIRNITGGFDVDAWAFNGEGAFANGSAGTAQQTAGGFNGRVDFDASRLVPTADENRPYSANLTYKICRGWKS